MKKIIAIILLSISLLSFSVSFCSCGKVVECDFCGNEAKESKMHVGEIFDETVYMCNECYVELKEWFE